MIRYIFLQIFRLFLKTSALHRRASRYAFSRTIRKNLGAFLHRYLHRCHRGAGFLPSLVFILNILFFKAFALTGRKADCAYTQGVTLG